MTSKGTNFASQMTRMALRRPLATAVISPRLFGSPEKASRYSYQQLEEETEILARGLLEIGIAPGVRSIFMIRPGFEFFGLAFALLKAGGVLVGVDPGMGRRSLTQCLREAAPQAFIGVPAAHVFRRMFGWAKDTLQILVSTSSRRAGRGGLVTLSALRELGRGSTQSLPNLSGGDPAIIAFTSGSTGPPKGAVYSHALLNAQVEALRDTFGIEEGERDLVTFPHFALFAPGLGATVAPARMDFARPGRAIPSWIVRDLRDLRITNLFASPALLSRIARYGSERGIQLPDLRRVVSAGAPVPAEVVSRIRAMMEGGTVYTPYGATEALPVTCITGEEILTETQARTEDGGGICVGRPVRGIELRVIRITDRPIEVWSDDLEVPAGEIGEIAVAGAVVSPTYFNRAEATAQAKIAAGGKQFHRMGDLGTLDSDGRLWFCGRKNQRVSAPGAEYYTIPVEAVFNSHPDVLRSALVGVRDDAGHRRPVLCVQLRKRVSASRWAAIRRDLLARAAERPGTTAIQDILRRRRFPVDRRHNAKIIREDLAVWAERHLR